MSPPLDIGAFNSSPILSISSTALPYFILSSLDSNTVTCSLYFEPQEQLQVELKPNGQFAHLFTFVVLQIFVPGS
jgi:hypothetical protein